MRREKTTEEVRDYAEMIARRQGWDLTRDEEMLSSLVSGLKENFNRLGYYNCPCRDNQGDAKLDADIICPCLYARQADVAEYGYCFCALFFEQGFDQAKATSQIPERRPPRPASASERPSRG